MLDFYFSRQHRRRILQAYFANTTAWNEAINKIIHYPMSASDDSETSFCLKGRKKKAATARRKAKRKSAQIKESHNDQDEIDHLVDFLGYEVCILVVVGDGQFYHASSGHDVIPSGKRITTELLKRGRTMCSADEFRTSMLCSKCHHKTRSIHQSDDHVQNHLDHSTKKGVLEHKLPRKHSIKSL
uniref:Uncharacterized protein n=1 Tax=Polytomella parva TaxID=51329 RepID=A0A7S0YFQ4_9CHLO|mmetsp:Transcript_24579/g.44182  ORF Transcript_24579/g.44182 Transcript_24579/m.44182 type:complete len:185 (+) Transcript_24579:1983-2537(+)